MKLSDYVAQYLSKITRHVFVGQGGCVVHLLDSINNLNKIKIIPSQNEQAASIAADAYSRVNNNYGVSISTSGPGMLNLMQGIACSFFDSVPTMHFSGAVVTSQLRKNKNLRQLGFQEMEVVDLVSPITKYAVLLKDKNKIRYELEKMYYISKSGRPGPVLMDLPDDLQRAEINPNNLEPFNIKDHSVNLSKNLDGEIEIIKKLLKSSERPLVILGNGVKLSDTVGPAKDFIEKNNLPYALTWAVADIFNFDHILNAGTFGVAANRYGNFAVQNSDLLIVLGSRLNTQLTGSNTSSFASKAKKIIVDIDSAELNKNNGVKIDLGINEDLRFFFKEINRKIINKKPFTNWVSKFKTWKKKYPICEEKYFLETKGNNPYVFFQTLSEMTGDQDILIPDASANLIWALQSYKLKGQEVFTAYNHSPMGYSMAATIGAYFANQNKRIICTIGDGSMQMNIQELQTIAHFKIPAKIFVINNGGYGLIKQTQDTWLNSRRVGVDSKSGLSLPDFKEVAKAYKIEAIEINNHNELKEKIDYVLRAKNPILCDVKISDHQKVIPKLESGKPIHDLSPLLSKDELESNMNI
jgi:acetolactate synthase-1/2/3 large subunit